MEKQICFLDMDCVIADFCRSPMFRPGDRVKNSPPIMFEEFFFETLPPVKGAVSAVRAILQSEKYDVHILSQPVKEAHYSYSEKAAWVLKWFPELSSKLTLTQNKELMSAPGRLLIDDSAVRWKEKWVAGGGIFLHFDYSSECQNHNQAQWGKILDILGITNKREGV